jgi:glycosyltransferase involved in cell wall biosynthesis
MMIFDTAYTWSMLVERNIMQNITGRDVGFFGHVWTVHPFGTLFDAVDDPERYGRPAVHPVNDTHTVIQGKIGRFRALRRFPKLNFLLAQIGLFRMLSKLVRRRPVHLLRSEDPLYNGLFAWALARLHRRPLVIGVWGNPGEIRSRTLRPLSPRLFRSVAQEERFERFMLRRADRVLSQNEDNRSFILSLGIPRERTGIFRLGNLINPVHFTDPAERPDGTPDLEALGVAGEQTLICVSRLEPLKLTDHVIRVVRVLKDKGRRVVALMVGDGTLRAEHEALAEELGVTDQIVFCGNRDQIWLSRVLPKVSAVLSPFKGRALAEVALGGVPVIAYDIDWHGELIESGVTGELVPRLDHVAMAQAVDRVLADPAYGRRLGENVRRRTIEMMHPAIVDRQQAEIYAEVLAERSR